MTGKTTDPQPAALRDARDLQDWDLISRAGAGDRSAFEALYKAYYQQLYRFVFKITRRLELIEDIINEVMLAVWQQAASVVPRSRASTWIFGIAHYKALQSLAKAGLVLPALDDDQGASGRFQESSAQAHEANEFFVRALEYLPPEQRAVLELVYHQELHYDEIALLLGIPANTVKTRVFHARRKLREVWPSLAGRPHPEITT